MAHFAKIGEGNFVERVIVISNCAIGGCIGPSHWDYQEEYHKDHDKGIDFPESEPLGQKVIADSGIEGRWIQTSYNNNFRVSFAGIGSYYNEALDAFVSPQI